MNYANEATNMLGVKFDPELPPELLRLYTLLVFAKGEACTLEDVHDAWSLWQTMTRPDHRSLTQFYFLRPEVQRMNIEYRDAIVSTAKELEAIYGRQNGMRCARCKNHTGNNHQGHHWAGCRVTKKTEAFHFCCPDGCELFNEDGSPRAKEVSNHD